MTKKIPITLLLTVVIAIVALFAATEAMAQEECSAGSVDMYPTPDYPFPMVLTEETTIDGQRVICKNELNQDSYPCYLWIVEVAGRKAVLSKITQGLFFYNYDPENPIRFRGGHPSATAYDPGQGGPNNYGFGIFQGVVVEVPAQIVTDRVLRYHFATDKSTRGFTSLAYRTGTDKVVPCDPGLKIVGYDPATIIPSEYVRQVDLPAGGCVRIHKHPVTGCIKEFRDCDGNLIPANPDGPSWITKEVPDLGSFDDKFCRNAVMTGKTGVGSDYEYWGYANGWWYCIGTYSTDEPMWCNFCGVCED